MSYQRKTKQISWRDNTLLDEAVIFLAGVGMGLFSAYGALAFFFGLLGIVIYCMLKITKRRN